MSFFVSPDLIYYDRLTLLDINVVLQNYLCYIYINTNFELAVNFLCLYTETDIGSTLVYPSPLPAFLCTES